MLCALREGFQAVPTFEITSCDRYLLLFRRTRLSELMFSLLR